MYIITCWLPVSFLLLLLFFPISFYHIITCMVTAAAHQKKLFHKPLIPLLSIVIYKT